MGLKCAARIILNQIYKEIEWFHMNDISALNGIEWGWILYRSHQKDQPLIPQIVIFATPLSELSQSLFSRVQDPIQWTDTWRALYGGASARGEGERLILWVWELRGGLAKIPQWGHTGHGWEESSGISPKGQRSRNRRIRAEGFLGWVMREIFKGMKEAKRYRRAEGESGTSPAPRVG